jgi:hypothetical protein
MGGGGWNSSYQHKSAKHCTAQILYVRETGMTIISVRSYIPVLRSMTCSKVIPSNLAVSSSLALFAPSIAAFTSASSC